MERRDRLRLKQGDLPPNCCSVPDFFFRSLQWDRTQGHWANVSDGTRWSERAVPPEPEYGGRSQSVRSSAETSNDGGAKGHRKVELVATRDRQETVRECLRRLNKAENPLRRR